MIAKKIQVLGDVGMEWIKNEEEIFRFLSDMKKVNQIANLDNYIKWIKDQSVSINQHRESDNLNIRIAVPDKQNNILIY
ncbi:TPA: hypothetical protein ACG830_000551 [Enterococcus faecium]